LEEWNSFYWNDGIVEDWNNRKSDERF